MRNYEATITFFFKAENNNDALGIADNIANYVETSENNFVEAKVGEVKIEE